MIKKTDKQISMMRKAGLIVWHAHEKARKLVKQGISTKEIDQAVEEYILSMNGIPLFKGVPGKVPYPASTCISINDEVVHGIPSNRKLQTGDIVSIDIGVKLNGWCADAAVTWPVGKISKDKRRLMNETEDALRFSIKQIASRTRWCLIARKMQKRIESKGFSIVEELVGHGIGKEMWEEPQVPNFYTKQYGDFPIIEGATIAIEPMVNMGTKNIITKEDHWTIVTRDGKPSAHFEHTVAITDKGPAVLTCGPNGEGWAM